jgi:hypothetical protein
MGWRVSPCFFGDFCMEIYSVDSDEAVNASSLQFLSIVKRIIASSLRFLLSVKRFIAVNFHRKTSFNASLPLLFKRNSLFNASSPLLFKVTLPTSDLQPSLGEGRWVYQVITTTRCLSFYVSYKAIKLRLLYLSLPVGGSNPLAIMQADLI